MISVKALELAQNAFDDFYRIRYLPSKDNITKILFYDLYLLFEGKKFETLISLLQTVRASAEMHKTIYFYLFAIAKVESI